MDRGENAIGADSRGVPTGAHFIPTLDGWRVIAISGVIVSHLAALQTGNSVFVHFGAQGVALFFAISGFLITTRLLIEYERTGTISLGAFYIRRAFRILPPAMLYLLTLGLLSLVGILTLRRGELFSAMFFFSNYWPDRSWFTAHFWSLSVEEHFYIMWPVVLLMLGSRRAKWFAAAVITATVLWRPFGAGMALAVPAFERTDMRLDAFMFACLLAILMRDRRFGPVLATVLSRPAVRVLVPVSLCTVYLLAMKYPELRLFKEFAQSALIPILIGGTVVSPKDWVGRGLDSSPMQVTGRLSYGIYLWQELFLTGVVPVPVAGRLMMLFGVAAITYYGFERQCMNWGRDLSKRVSTTRPPER